ncbi:tetratricopeptide repeat protein [Argonema antarcticum]|uniref:tetratricopeptide repeat protein n=1 Tax=Argonema antarcticum TaxID=2942763 RepID=UPI0020136F09|nr:tetratricopeptide repeat protein [Argonema antarcticum]MCL1469640.1 tetratricopeptide repeat protein [Argonema antarcticum A004/B2]
MRSSLLTALQHYQAGRLSQAEQIYSQILQKEPYNIDALQLLGITATGLGKHELAIECFRKAIEVAPGVADFHYNLGMALQEQNRVEEALVCYQQTLALEPNHAGAYYNLGKALQEQGRLPEATACYQQAILLEPNYAELHNRLGIVLQEQGLLAEATTYYNQALTIDPNYDDAYSNLGSVWLGQGELEEAIICYQQALALKPDDALLYNNLGGAMYKQRRLVEAVDCYQKALVQEPDNPVLYSNLGVTLKDLGKLEEAITCYRQALALDPNYAEAYSNLGGVMKQQKQLQEALACYRQALALNPHQAEFYNNLGNALEDGGEIEEALVCYRQALALNPKLAMTQNNLAHALLFQGKVEKAIAYLQPNSQLNPSDRFSRAYLLLLAGDLQRGFAEYESRWLGGETPPRQFPQPLWDGSRLEGRTILLHAEQGLGDTIQFIRYAPLVAAYGGRLIVDCPRSLIRLLESISCIDRLIVQDTTLPEFDVHAPLMSLPWILGTTLENVPAQIPYLAPPESSIELEIPSESKLKVGIVWATYSSGKTAELRSSPLSHFLKLTDIPGIAFYSLEKDPQEQDLILLRQTACVQNLSHLLNDFADTAAIVAQLDLVITIDTSVAHLAGALGKQVWVLLPFDSDWRWMLHRQDSPWYPTMRLFRQPQPGDWQSLFVLVTQTLRNLANIAKC